MQECYIELERFMVGARTTVIVYSKNEFSTFYLNGIKC